MIEKQDKATAQTFTFKFQHLFHSNANTKCNGVIDQCNMTLFKIEWQNNFELLKSPLTIKCMTTDLERKADNVIINQMNLLLTIAYCITSRMGVCVLFSVQSMCHIDQTGENI